MIYLVDYSPSEMDGWVTHAAEDGKTLCGHTYTPYPEEAPIPPPSTPVWLTDRPIRTFYDAQAVSCLSCQRSLRRRGLFDTSDDYRHLWKLIKRHAARKTDQEAEAALRKHIEYLLS